MSKPESFFLSIKDYSGLSGKYPITEVVEATITPAMLPRTEGRPCR